MGLGVELLQARRRVLGVWAGWLAWEASFGARKHADGTRLATARGISVFMGSAKTTNDDDGKDGGSSGRN